MSHVDAALLKSEWEGRTGFEVSGEWCPVCGGPRPKHNVGCEQDLALAERGYPTQVDRDAARSRLSRQSAPTLIPPAVCLKCGGPLANEIMEGCTSTSCLIRPTSQPRKSQTRETP